MAKPIDESDAPARRGEGLAAPTRRCGAGWRAAALVVLHAAALALVGCGGSSGDGAAAPTSGATASPGGVALGAPEARGQVLFSAGGRGNCVRCHTSAATLRRSGDAADTVAARIASAIARNVGGMGNPALGLTALSAGDLADIGRYVMVELTAGATPPATPGTTTPPPGAGPATPSGSFTPVAACTPAQPRKVTRLSDRHLGNALRDLLGLAAAPVIRTTSGDREAFFANKAAALDGAVALSLRDAVEAAAAQATTAGRPAVRCTGDAETCARAYIDRFGARAFRRPLSDVERTGLLEAYRAGARAGSGHADGIRTVIEAALQSPSFLYVTELGQAAGSGYRLDPYELATVLSLFLRDSVPDDALWQAAVDGRLATPAGLTAEIDRLLALPEVRRNVTRTLGRLFHTTRVRQVSKTAAYPEFTPALAAAMAEESERFIDDVLWRRGGTLDILLTSRQTQVDKSLAALYGVPHSGAATWESVTLPAQQRAGLLTHASVLSAHARPDDTSVVHRGVFVAAELLCHQPAPPQASDLQAGEDMRRTTHTERERADLRAANTRCAGCHARFDPLGLNFESFDTIGRWRTRIDIPTGSVPADASSTPNLFDVAGPIPGAAALAERLAASRAVKACMARQLAGYAVQQRVPEANACTTRTLADAFEASNGDLLRLVRSVATWDALVQRTAN